VTGEPAEVGAGESASSMFCVLTRNKTRRKSFVPLTNTSVEELPRDR
jgi:hypothetical protein